MKICSKCKIQKTKENFWKSNSKDGLYPHCKECDKKRNYYVKHINKMKKAQRVRSSILRTKNRKLMIEFLSNKKCTDCGESNIEVLEFDHIKGKKKDKVPRILLDYAWPVVLKEIKKCEIVCSNCHRLRTEQRINSYRYRFFNNEIRGDIFKDFALSKLSFSHCKDCKTTLGIVLDYDHRNRKTKTAKIADIIRRRNCVTIQDLQAEIKKCDVRCANCHRIRTNRQLDSYKIGNNI